MAESSAIGILFRNHDNWTGGTYYLLNVVHALAALPVDRQPKIVVFLENFSDEKLFSETRCQQLSILPIIPEQGRTLALINSFSQHLFSRSVVNPVHASDTVSAVFPYGLEKSLKNVHRKVCWIPDFQEHFHPEFFSPSLIRSRRSHHEQLIGRKVPIVLSSLQAEKDFRFIYPKARNETFVVSFATWHPDYHQIDLADVLRKYCINEPYVITPNQFWKHKNHGVLLEAFRLLRNNSCLQLVLTGREHDFRHPNYPQQLRSMAADYGLSHQVRFLGFIDRREQLKLMQHALAVIQPSLFEGWNTGIEDAKAMSQRIIASDIAVHLEQLVSYPDAIFFSPRDAESLAVVLRRLESASSKRIEYDYESLRRAFGERFLCAVRSNRFNEPS